MSTAPGTPTTSAFRQGDDSSVGASSELNAQIVQETRNEIRELIQEITQLSQQDLPQAEYLGAFLSRVLSALVAVGGAIWLRKESGELELAYRINLEAAQLSDAGVLRHQHLLRRVLQQGEALAVLPRSGFPDDDTAGNPTDYLVLLVPIVREQQTVGLVEILQRPGVGPTTQRGYLRFLVQMAELAASFLKNQRLKQFADREQLWGQLDQFLTEIHKSLSLPETAYAVVNETRLLVACDRVSLLLKRGSQYVLTAVSGLDHVERRTEQASLMTRFATTVLSTGEAFWSDEATSLPPQIESPWHNYVDLTHVKSLALIPLRTTSAGERAEQEICGALVLESLSDAHFTPAQRARMNLVVHYATPSLLHALEHDRIFLMPVWKALGAWRTHLTTTRIAKLSAFAAVSVAIVLLLTCLPWSFNLAARGKVVPRERWEIFAPENGTIISVPVRHGQTVQAGDLLAQLENTELSVQIANLLGRQRITQEQWQANHRALLDSGRGRPKLHPADENRLSGELLQLKQTLAGIEQELQLLREQESRLAIRAQQAGEVVTWQVEQLLLRRPVQQGQALMSVVNPEGDWELELQVPERRLRHLDAAQLEQPQQPLAVSFMLSNLPGREFSGLVREIERTTEASPEGNVIFVRVTFDKHQLPPLRSDTSVTAKLHCGQRSLGYVWFCDLIETVQTHVLFWL